MVFGSGPGFTDLGSGLEEKETFLSASNDTTRSLGGIGTSAAHLIGAPHFGWGDVYCGLVVLSKVQKVF